MPSLSFLEVATLPRLAWLAVVDPGAGRAYPREFVVVHPAPRRLSFLRPLADRVAGLARHAPSFRFVFPWALARMKQRYAADRA